MTTQTISMTTELGLHIDVLTVRSLRSNGKMCVRLVCKEKTCTRRCDMHFVIPRTLWSVSDAELADVLSSHCVKMVKMEHATISKLFGLTNQELSVEKEGE